MNRFQIAKLAALLLVTAPAAALAHAKMTASKPEDGSTVAPGVSEIELSFSHPLRLSTVHMRDGNKHKVPLKSELPTSFARVARVSVNGLTPGSYEVTWTAVAEDGHVMRGSFAFSVKAEKTAAQPAR